MFSIGRNKNIVPLPKKSFAELGFTERYDLQEWIAQTPAILGENLLIIQKEFDGFYDTRERLDLLALDTAGNLVIIENKLDDSGRDVVWQALKYVSYCALLTKNEIRDIYQKYLGASVSAEDRLCEFFGEEDYENVKLNPQGGDQRLILVAANFRKEVTTTALWLRDHGVDIKCMRVTPFQHGDQVFIDPEQIIPVPDVEDYQVRLSAKKQEDIADSKGDATRHKLRREFWAAALPVIGESASIFKGKNPTKDHWLSGTSHGGVQFNLLALKDKVRLEIYIDAGEQEKNKAVFARLFTQKAALESAFGAELDWLELPDKRASRILFTCGDEFSLGDKDTWDSAICWLAEHMKKLHEVFKKPVELAVKS
jgi:hypothetical protein